MHLQDYQFRTNWLGRCILQRRVQYQDGTIGWIDAKSEDLRDYYQELLQLDPKPQQLPLL